MATNHFQRILVVGLFCLTIELHLPLHTQAAEDQAAARIDLEKKIAKLVQQLGADRFSVREAATRELIALGRPALSALQKALDSGDAEVRLRAEKILHTIGTTLDFLLVELKSRDPARRKQAADRIEQLGARARVAVPVLTTLLKDPSKDVREAAAMALISIDPDNKALAETSLKKASVDGKYRKLLRRILVEQDKQGYGEFRDYGQYSGTSYAGHDNLPVGYWVYVYPHWYIWDEQKKP